MNLNHTFEYFSLSSAVYNYPIENFELSSVPTLTRLTSKTKKKQKYKQNTYSKHVFANLNDIRQKSCVLLNLFF